MRVSHRFGCDCIDCLNIRKESLERQAFMTQRIYGDSHAYQREIDRLQENILIHQGNIGQDRITLTQQLPSWDTPQTGGNNTSFGGGLITIPYETQARRRGMALSGLSDLYEERYQSHLARAIEESTDVRASMYSNSGFWNSGIKIKMKNKLAQDLSEILAEI